MLNISTALFKPARQPSRAMPSTSGWYGTQLGVTALRDISSSLSIIGSLAIICTHLIFPEFRRKPGRFLMVSDLHMNDCSSLSRHVNDVQMDGLSQVMLSLGDLATAAIYMGPVDTSKDVANPDLYCVRSSDQIVMLVYSDPK